ncbi:helix-turn-helix domain-containing protein [Sinomonas sp. ASV322]|uniref:helix-turn-helix domain-containing protein n=1 Tax=Sinomonas sp. ASV322 TaxID=3041920 RepID=UPI0027DBD8DC|nr:helix-turn-helix domain-containing protein [Sinomonas sp. ASV322]MDQ4502452.1 helix-turn-helix domain-containing protein [Sinomonas sp. ASV322]
MREWTEGVQQDFLGPGGLAELGGLVSPLAEAGSFALRMKSVAVGGLYVSYVAASPCYLSGQTVSASVDRALHMVFPFDTQLVVEDFIDQGVPVGGLVAFGEANLPRIRMESAGRVLVVSMTEGVRSSGAIFSKESPSLVISSSPSVAVVRAVAELVFRSEERDAAMSEILAGVCGMVLLDAYIASEAEPRDDKLVVVGLRIIAEEFRRKDFKARNVAEALGISLRVLQRAFADRGGVTNVIRTYRTQEALRILGSDAANGVSFDAIARKSGFADGRAMRKAIADSTGMLPNQYRKNFG